MEKISSSLSKTIHATRDYSAAQQRRDGSCMHDRAASKSVPGSRVPYLVNERLDAVVRRAAAAHRRARRLLPARCPPRHRRGLGPAHRLLDALVQGTPCQRRRSADADPVHVHQEPRVDALVGPPRGSDDRAAAASRAAGGAVTRAVGGSGGRSSGPCRGAAEDGGPACRRCWRPGSAAKR